MTVLRITARSMLAMNASDAAMRKFLEDPEAIWVHMELKSQRFMRKDLPEEEDTEIVGRVWSPKFRSFKSIVTLVTAIKCADCFAMRDAFVKDKESGRSILYFFGYESNKSIAEELGTGNPDLPGFVIPGA